MRDDGCNGRCSAGNRVLFIAYGRFFGRGLRIASFVDSNRVSNSQFTHDYSAVYFLSCFLGVDLFGSRILFCLGKKKASVGLAEAL